MRASFIAPALTLFLAACGGGSGTPPPPLAFTSAQTASIVENTTAAYQASANNPNRGSLVFSIEGGTDAARFAITAAGALSFVEAPDYDVPGDADGDNVYAVRLRVSDGRGEVVQPVNITVTNSREGISVRRIATGLTDPVAMSEINGDSRYMLIAERGGTIYAVSTDGSGDRLVWRTMPNISTGGERGILGMMTDGTLRTGIRMLVIVTGTDGAIEVRDLIYYASGFQRERAEATIYRFPQTGTGVRLGGGVTACHGGPCLLLGDGGDSAAAQDPYSPFGKVLRLGMNGHDDPVAAQPPRNNPFANGGGHPLVFAVGLRDPSNPTYLYGQDVLLFGDSGPGALEELNLMPITQPPSNFGWPFREGTRDFSGTAPSGLTNPVAEYPHGTGPREGRSIVGGIVRNSGSDAGYIFGDAVSGNIWTLPLASLVAGQTLPASRFSRRNEDYAPDAGSIDRPVAFRDYTLGRFILDGDGELFLVTTS